MNEPGLSLNDIVGNSIFNLLSPPTEICAVCGDIANGFHYGVLTCENCKSCFRRFKVKPPVKRCESGGHCVITPWSKKCVTCKFKKCLEVGMGVKKNSRSRPYTLKTLSPASSASSTSLLSQLVDVITTESVQEQTTLSKLANINTNFVSSFLESVKTSVDSCKVCGDIAKHFHSGVRTCRGCSTFFYRFPSRVQTSMCPSGGNCVMTIVKRDCAPCRYKKCLEVGMVHRTSPPGDKEIFKTALCYQKGKGEEGCSLVKADYEQGIIKPEESNPTRDMLLEPPNIRVKMENDEVMEAPKQQSSHLNHDLNNSDGVSNPSFLGTNKQETSSSQPLEIPVPSSAEFHVSKILSDEQNVQSSINSIPTRLFSSTTPELYGNLHWSQLPAWPHQELRVIIPVFKPQPQVPPILTPDLAETIRNCVQQYGRKAPTGLHTAQPPNEKAIEEDKGIATQDPAPQPMPEQNKMEPSNYLRCEVCGGPARFSHCGARACKACAVFFNRQLGRKVSEQCRFTQNCIIKADSKTKCTFCRFKKCFAAGMILMNSSSEEYTEAYQRKFKEHMEAEFISSGDEGQLKTKRPRKSPSKGPCEVCGDQSRTGKYGVRTCKTCAEFFARQKLSPPIRKCSEPQPCVIASKRKKCRSCRYQKCLELGMTYNEVEFEPPVTESSPQPYGASILLLKELLLFHQRQNSCKVCGGKSTGIHHGVLSCDICEVLFSRVNQDRSRFKCENQGKCELQKGLPICLSCHYNKCLAVGMVSQNSVGFEGSPSQSESPMETTEQPSATILLESAVIHEGTSEQQSLSPSQTGSPMVTIDQSASNSNEPADIHEELPEQQSSSYSHPGSPIKTADPPALISNTPPITFPNQYIDGMANFLKAYEDTGNYTVGKMANMVHVEYDWKIDEISDSVTNRLSAWQHYSKALELDLETYADLISSLENEANQLSIDDKFEMFNRNGIKMLILNVTRALSSQGLYLSDGRFIELPVLKLLYGEELLNDMLDLSRKILELEFLDEDIALLILLGYYQVFEEPGPSENQLNDEKHVKELHEQYKSHIKLVCQRDEVALEKYEEMVNLIPRIHQIYLKHNDLAGFLNEHGVDFEHGTYFRGAYMKTKYQYEQVADETNKALF